MKDAGFVELAREILAQGHSIRFKAHGSSMFPLIQNGDFLTVRPFEGWDAKPGDVIFYLTRGDKSIVHRVIRIDSRNDHPVLITRGDASPSSRERVQKEQVLGKVIEIHRGNRRIHLNRNLWWILSRHLPVYLPIIYLVVRVHRKFRLDPTFSR
jgi:signal peptidase